MTRSTGPKALARLKEDEQITITAQRWQFEIATRAVIERLRDVTHTRNNAIHAVEESQLNQLIDCYESILVDFGAVLGHVDQTISVTQQPGMIRVPITFYRDELEDEGEGEVKSNGKEERRNGEERRTRTDLTWDSEDRRTGQDRREPASVG